VDSLDAAMTLTSPVRSPSGRFVLTYRSDGSAAILDEESGEVRWVAGGMASPAAGPLLVGRDGDLQVHVDGAAAWQSGPLAPGAMDLVVTDEGDGIFRDIHARPLAGLLSGAIETVSLGSSAPVARIAGTHYLRSESGRSFVVRLGDGGLKVSRGIGYAATSVTLPAEQAASLDQDGTELTWRFVEHRDGWMGWNLCLVGRDGNVRWEHMPEEADDGPAPPAAGAEAAEAPAETALVPAEPARPPANSAYSGAWAEALRLHEAYRVIAIRDVGPDESLRRLGTGDDQISTSTWRELLRRASFEDADPLENEVAAAFALGPHTLIVQPYGWFPLDAERLAPDTLAVISSCSTEADTSSDVFRNGHSLAGASQACSADGTEPSIVLAALAEMGVDEPEERDGDQYNRIDGLELLCRMAGIRPTLEDATGPARVAIFPVDWSRLTPPAPRP
jgi:hypothetical protein